ncbi:MAG: polysaccharide biosynthesis C-terminal domain-containing protein, partial [Clostridia bacterium]|nr:polysaccharide biosynthesis C-terminal domain-containing protein [Clostridia bacterium]
MGAALSSVISYFLCVVVGWATMSKLLGNNENLVKNISKILMISVIIGLIIYGLTFLLSRWWLVLTSIAITPIVYFILVLLFKVFTNDELYSFPFGTKIAKLDNKIHKQK